jgi:SAM-dependent methyltransferase
VTGSGVSALSLVCPRCRGPLAVSSHGAGCEACGARYTSDGRILRLTLGREGAPGYDPHFFDTLERVEGRHFWFVSRREVILDALRRAVPDLPDRALFDIGCGSGGLVEFLEAEGVTVRGACDAYLESLEIVRRRVRAPLVLVDEGRLPPLGPGQTALGLFDVLEHLDDDRGLLRFLHSTLAPGGVLVLTVPAHPFLFDDRDELAHHRRRYRRSELRDKLVEAGFEIRLLSHFMAALVLPLLVSRAFTGLLPRSWRRRRERQILEFRVVPVLNGLLKSLLAVERLVLRVGGLPFGSSLIAVATRPVHLSGREGPPMIGPAEDEERRAAE